ncbi:hypothetical protein DPSP01_004357 [Paraphaeosphaeria sporulosa]|uniref:Uncharacterized protein n=1 Tax=Paraphaeosphaeria sporulosa TaxID=1460663 RepID=A0A177CIQ4_9PLEO|nr:uncharacterized protein CC84DRAFT_1163368 [Paraphaeosphaeria sporulosa]OAG07141.1 hypothetical protein CC84DRAFT_1163368 [Paraphaeosphaeria sporulosa]
MDVTLESEMSPWLLMNDPWDNDSLVSSKCSEILDWEDDWWGGCPCCALSTRSFYVAENQANDLFAADFADESHMNAAGRTTMHPYRDLRSASYARKRSFKKSKPRPRTRGIAGRKWEHAYCRRENKRNKKETLRFEIYANQRREKVHWWSSENQNSIEFVIWDMNLEEDFDQYIAAMWDGVVGYEVLHKHAEVFENSELYTETGETVSVWAQRRIAEMRAVKDTQTRTQAAPRRTRIGVGRFDYQINCGSPLTTKLSTNAYAAYGHTQLRAALTRPTQARQMARFNLKIPPSPRIHNYNWFGEYTWRWHRKASGCWQMGYGDCGNFAMPCPCSESGCFCYFLRCYCEKFEGQVVPEEQQRYSLLEWAGAEGSRFIEADKAWEQAEGPMRECDTDVATESDGEWSFVNEDCGVRSCSSVASSVELSYSTRP